jgi:hypothetical protein
VQICTHNQYTRQEGEFRDSGTGVETAVDTDTCATLAADGSNPPANNGARLTRLSL